MSLQSVMLTLGYFIVNNDIVVMLTMGHFTVKYDIVEPVFSPLT